MSTRRESVTSSIIPRIKSVLTAAEQTAALVTEEAESEAGRRANELLAIADADADRIRREATRRVEEYLAESRRRIDAFATARIERITELTEGVIEASASIQERFEQATAVQREVHAMVEALGAVAEAVASEVAKTSPTLPNAPAGASSGEDGPGWAQTGPDGAVVGEVSANGRARRLQSDADTGDVVDREDGEDGVELDLAVAYDAESEVAEEAGGDSGGGGIADVGPTDRDDDGEMTLA
jgi:hypothetical protein